MPKAKDESTLVMSGDVVAGMLTIPAEDLANLPAQEFNRTWVVLASDGAKVRIPTTVDGETTVVAEYRVNLTIMRSPVSDDEKAKVAAIAAERDKSAKQREKAEQDRREREITAATERATNTTITTLLRMKQDIAAGQAAASLARRLGI